MSSIAASILPRNQRRKATRRAGLERGRSIAAAMLLAVLAALPGTSTALSGADAGADTGADTGYNAAATTSDARFGAQAGAGAQWESQWPAASGPGAAGQVDVTFGGGVRLGCSGVDLNGFLHRFDPAEILAEIRNSLLNGAQAAASNYLITLAYANPTMSSVLDMMDKKYTARFSAFAQACDAQAARARGQERGARALAQSGDECFDQETARGTAPSEAYRRCSILHTFDARSVPAAAATADFLRNFTHVNVTREIEALLALLPDERIDNGSYQFRPPLLTMAAMSQRLRDQTRRALDRIDTGRDPASIPACSAGAFLDGASAPDGCVPASAAALVSSSAFRGARLLGGAARTLFKDALSSQIAIGALYSNLLELFQQTAHIDVRAGSGADAGQAEARRRQLRESIGDLLVEADAQVKAQAARMQVVRLQMLALEHVQTDLESRAQRQQDSGRLPQFGLRNILSIFTGPP